MENTLEAALKQWQEREQRYEKLFSPSVLKSREFIKEKLKHFDGLRAKVIVGSLNEDRLAMRALHLERRQLARQAYPNVIARLVNWIVSDFRLDRDIAKLRVENQKNSEGIRAAMEKAGFGKDYPSVQEQMRQGSKEFSVPVSYHVNEHERMDVQMNFKKSDGVSYIFENYKAMLHNEQEKGKPKQHTFSQDSGTPVNTEQAYNLLAGRAIHNAADNSWQQLDFNDRDASGNYRIKHFHEGYGFDLAKALSGLPLKQEQQQQIVSRLMQGEKVAVQLSDSNWEYSCNLAANPQRHGIDIFNSEGGKVSLAELKGNVRNNKQAANVRQMNVRKKQVEQKGKSVKL